MVERRKELVHINYYWTTLENNTYTCIQITMVCSRDIIVINVLVTILLTMLRYNVEAIKTQQQNKFKNRSLVFVRLNELRFHSCLHCLPLLSVALSALKDALHTITHWYANCQTANNKSCRVDCSRVLWSQIGN